MGNVPPTGKSSKPTPPSSPRGNRSDNRSNTATALSQTVQSIQGHAQGAPSPTITLLPPGATISLLTPQQMSALGPPTTRQQVLGELEPQATRSGKMKFTLPVAGVDETSASVHICPAFSSGLRRCGIAISDERVGRHPKKGIVIRFNAKAPPTEEVLPHHRALGGNYTKVFGEARVLEAAELTMGLFRSLLELGIDLSSISYLMNHQVVWDALSDRKDWKLDRKREQDDPDVLMRKACVEIFIQNGCFEAATALVYNLAQDCGIPADFAIERLAKKSSIQIDPSLVEGDDKLNLKRFSALVAHLDPVLAGRFVLCDILTTDNNSSALQPYQTFVLEALNKMASRLDEVGRAAMLRRLLDLPWIDRGDLFRNAKAKVFLSSFPVSGPFEAIEDHYQQIFQMKMTRLRERFVFGGEADQLEIFARSPHAPVSEKSIDLFLDLAEAATHCAGQIGTAIGVLKFLASREELSEKQKQKVIALCDQVRMAVRFDLDPDIANSFDSVVKEIDEIVAKIEAS